MTERKTTAVLNEHNILTGTLVNKLNISGTSAIITEDSFHNYFQSSKLNARLNGTYITCFINQGTRNVENYSTAKNVSNKQFFTVFINQYNLSSIANIGALMEPIHSKNVELYEYRIINVTTSKNRNRTWNPVINQNTETEITCFHPIIGDKAWIGLDKGFALGRQNVIGIFIITNHLPALYQNLTSENDRKVLLGIFSWTQKRDNKLKTISTYKVGIAAVKVNKDNVNGVRLATDQKLPNDHVSISLDSKHESVSNRDKFTFAKAIIQNLNRPVLFSFAFLSLFVLAPNSSVISGVIWLIALLLSYCDPTLGRFASYLDIWVDENFTDYAPKGTVISTITLDGQLTLSKFKALFIVHVLNKRLSADPSKVRYPELQQYFTQFCGFRIWKFDPYFKIDNHIIEWKSQRYTNLEAIIQELINKSYCLRRSPWEIVLINLNAHKNSRGLQSILILRSHHVLMDAKSILKMTVECLGQKPLKTAHVSHQNFHSNFQFYLKFPYYMIVHNLCAFYKFYTSHSHPWKNTNFRDEKYSKLLISFSKRLKVSDLKRVAKKFKVTGSSVIIAIITGAVRNFGVELSIRDITIEFPLPKRNHPETLANHMYYGVLTLPTDESSIVKRLEKCNQVIVNAKSTKLGKCTNIVAIQGGSAIFPFSKVFPVNYFVPMIITNIAGEEEGFEVGGIPCSDFRMITGPFHGAASILFSVFSYKDTFRVGISAKENIFTKQQIDKLTTAISNELNTLVSHDANEKMKTHL